MAQFWGADTEALRSESTSVEGGARQMGDLAQTLSLLISSVQWIGPDAESFRADWASTIQPQLEAAIEDLNARASDLREHADEQDSASDSDAGAGALGAAAAAAAAAVGATAFVPASLTTQLSGPADAAMMADAAMRDVAFAASNDIGNKGLKYTDTGMQLEPPKTSDTVKVDSKHDLHPGKNDPFGFDSDGKPIKLDPNTKYTVKDQGTFYTNAQGNVTYVEAEGANSGAMNPSLRTTFPDATYHVNDNAYYQTDELGRTEHMYVPDAELNRDMGRSTSAQQNVNGKYDMLLPNGKTENIGFDAGHALARELGGVREEINYSRQWNQVNGSRAADFENIRDVERTIAEGLSDGKSYTYETRINYGDMQPHDVGPHNPDSKPYHYVPESYDVYVTEDGKTRFDTHMKNYPDGATFVEPKGGKKK